MELPEFFTVAQVAVMLDVTEKSVRDFINAGEIEAVKIGQWRISRQSLAAFMQSRGNYFRSRARKEVLSFLDGDDALQAGEEKSLLVLDYYSIDPRQHGELVNSLSSAIEGKFRWTFYFSSERQRVRHVLQGELSTVLDLAAALDRRVKEMKQ